MSADAFYRWKGNNPAGAAAHQARYDRSRRIRTRELVNSRKDRPCSDCGESYPPYIMDFDHVRGEKLFEISKAVNGGGKKCRVGKEKLLAEMDKCDVVCSNCHRERRHQRQVLLEATA